MKPLKRIKILTCLLHLAACTSYGQATADSATLTNTKTNAFSNYTELDSKDTVVDGIDIGVGHIFTADIRFRAEKIIFFEGSGKTKSIVGEDKLRLAPGELCSHDLNGDGIDEILIQTYPNMNANRWLQVYKYNAKTKKIVHAADLSTDFCYDAKSKLVKVYYEGSSYMEHSFETYKWYGDKLVQMTMILLTEPDESSRVYLEYYKNTKPPRTNLTRIFRVLYNEKTPGRYSDYWNEMYFIKQVHGD